MNDIAPNQAKAAGLKVVAIPDHVPSPGSDGSGLTARNLIKRFKKRPVLRGVSLSLSRGEAVGLLGPNGAGKTTCFYILTGLIRPDAGSIELDGYDITELPMYRRARMGIGYLPQEASIFRGLSVEQNIRAVLEVVEPDRARREAQLDELLAEFSIAHLRQAPALALSGGNLVISWPTNESSGAVLQQNSDLSSTNWIATPTNFLTVTNGQYRVLASPTNAQQFFRLYTP